MTTLLLTCEKDRHAEPFKPIALRMVPQDGTCVIDSASAPTGPAGDTEVSTQRLGPQQKKVLEALHAAPGGLSNEQWVQASGVPERTFYACKKRLIAERLVHLREDGMYGVSDVGKQ